MSVRERNRTVRIPPLKSRLTRSEILGALILGLVIMGLIVWSWWTR